MDGRVLEVDFGWGRSEVYYNYLTDKWRSYPEGYLITSGDEVIHISQWRETGQMVAIGE